MGFPHWGGEVENTLLITVARYHNSYKIGEKVIGHGSHELLWRTGKWKNDKGQLDIIFLPPYAPDLNLMN